MFRRRRPLLRAAAVGGLAYHAGKKMGEANEIEAERDQELLEESVQPGLSDASIDQLKKLNELKEAGVLTPEEFEAEKQKILGA